MERTNSDLELNTLKDSVQAFKKYLMWMVIANVVLTFALIFKVGMDKVVMVPQVAPEYKMWIAKSQASPEYLDMLSRNLLDLGLDIAPNNVKAQHAELMSSVDPKYKADLQSKLTEISKQLIQNNLSQVFFIENVRVVNKEGIAYVKGTLKQYIDKNMSSSNSQVYKLTYKVRNYKAYLDNIELIPENDPQLRD